VRGKRKKLNNNTESNREQEIDALTLSFVVAVKQLTMKYNTRCPTPLHPSNPTARGMQGRVWLRYYIIIRSRYEKLYGRTAHEISNFEKQTRELSREKSYNTNIRNTRVVTMSVIK